MYFKWRVMALCSVFLYDIILWILFAICRSEYYLRWWWSDVYLRIEEWLYPEDGGSRFRRIVCTSQHPRRPWVVTVFIVVPRNFGFPIAGHREAFGRVVAVTLTVSVRERKCPSGALCWSWSCETHLPAAWTGKATALRGSRALGRVRVTQTSWQNGPRCMEPEGALPCSV